MSNGNSKVWEDFMNTEFAQRKLEQIKKEAQSADRDKLYRVDPKNKTELSKSTETMGTSSGGGSLVGGGDSKSLYTLKSTSVPGGAESYADAVVEGLEDVHARMLEVAHKEPKGNPKGTQDNKSEKWEGLQAAGNAVKSFTKSAMESEMAHEMDDEAEHKEEQYEDDSEHDNKFEEMLKMLKQHEDKDKSEHDDEFEEILKMLKEHEDEDKKHTDEMSHEMSHEMKHEMAKDLEKSAGNVSLLRELVKIANDLDAQGNFEDASEIDAVVEAETKALIASLKKK